MKNFKNIFALAICVLFVSFAAFADSDIPVEIDQLPASVKTFVSTHFPEQNIVYAELEHGYKYEIRLNDGSKIEILKSGEFQKAECVMKAVPASLIPAKIADYIKKNHADSMVTEIEKKAFGYKVELNDHLELIFGADGKFMGFDD